MTLFLTIQNTYEQLELGIFNGTELVALNTTPKIKGTALLIPLLQDLLRDQGITFSEIDFIAVNQGPGPFSTLRVVISSVNGLQFATGIPLVPVNALHALAAQVSSTQYPNTLIMLNAFGAEVYFGLAHNGQLTLSGCDTPAAVLKLCAATITRNDVVCVGNAIGMYQGEISTILGERALIPEAIPHYPSLATIGAIGLKQWEKRLTSNQLMPLYLKKAFKD